MLTPELERVRGVPVTADEPVEQAAEVLRRTPLSVHHLNLTPNEAQELAAALRDAGLLGGQEAVERVRAALDELRQWVGNGPGRSDPVMVEGFEKGIELASEKIHDALDPEETP